MLMVKNENTKSERLSLSVSALLHPTPSTGSSEPGSAHSVHSVQSSSGNGNSPPHGAGAQQGGQQQQGLQGAAVEDARVVGVLNKRFCG